jgi:Mg-chelatase subunit ChlD
MAAVTIVGTGGATGALARAFGAMPAATVRTLTAPRYLAARQTGGGTPRAGSGLLVLDGWLPPESLPRPWSGPVLYVDPPALPGGSVAGHLRDPVLSGTDDTSTLLAGVDLTSLSVPVPATERIAPPAWMAPVAWTPSGPLLAAGTSGTLRAAVLAFDPARTNLPQLAAFPILLGNILQWATGQAGPPAAQPQAPAQAQAEAQAEAHLVRFTGHPGTRAEPSPPLPWWRWAVLGALLAITAETSYLVAAAGKGKRTAGRSRSLGAVTARLAALALFAAALAGPALTRPGGGAPLLLLDRSGSIAGASLAAEDGWAQAIRDAAPTAQTVSFGTGTGTDIAQAIRLGDAAVTGGSASRVVLVSDGLATSGDAVAAASGTAIPVDVADIARTGPDTAVTRLAAPRAVRAGDTIPLQVTVHATVARPAVVTIWRDGRAVSRLTLRLAAGDNPLLISSPSGPPGWRDFRVAVAMAGDTVPRNDALDAVTEVTAAPRLLYVGSGGWFTALLRRLGFEVEVRPAAAVPATASAFTGFQGIILNDIPNGQLVPAQLTALSTAVRTEGAGLLVLGGTHSLTASWYAGTPLAAALPVAGTGSGPQGSAALELVLDHSGSMIDLAGGVTKISMARAAALGAIAFARGRHDRLGIISFDIAPHVIVPMQVMTAASAAAADRAVDGLTANGGTNIYGALQAAAGQIAQLPDGIAQGSAGGTTPPYPPATSRQIILMTDGVSQSAYYDTLVGRLRASGVTLTSVGLGDQVDKALLQRLAAAGGGRYYYTNNAADLPRIFAAEERLSVRPAHISGRIPAQVQASVPAVRSLVGTRVPDAGGLDATMLKPFATSDVTTGAVAGGERYPLLAQWQYGLGRVAVWTPGTAPDWLAGWAGEPDLWNDTVRWLLPGVPVPVLQPRLLDAYPGGAATVVVDTLRNDGVLLTAPLLRASVTPPRGSGAPAAQGAQVVLGLARAADPGIYTGTLPDAGPGVYRIVVTPPATAGTGPAVSTELAVGYPREYLPSPVGAALLAQVAAATGGRVLADPAGSAAWESAHNGAHRVAVWWLFAVLALAAFLTSVWLRPPPPARTGRASLVLQPQIVMRVGGQAARPSDDAVVDEQIPSR